MTNVASPARQLASFKNHQQNIQQWKRYLLDVTSAWKVKENISTSFVECIEYKRSFSYNTLKENAWILARGEL